MMWSGSTSLEYSLIAPIDIIILMIGDNDVFFDTDCEGLAGRLVPLATMFCNRGLIQHVIITRFTPRFGIPCCLLDRIQGNTVREKKEWYLRMINMEPKDRTRAQFYELQYHALNDFLRSARYGHRERCYSCFKGPFEDARHPYGRRNLYLLPPWRRALLPRVKPLSLRSYNKLIGWFKLPCDADVTTQSE